MKEAKLALTRHQLEEICRHFLPYMLSVLGSRLRSAEGSGRLAAIVTLSVLEDLEVKLQRRTLTRQQQKFKITLKQAEAAIFFQLLCSFPLNAEDFWRIHLRDYLITQLDRQLANQ